MKSVGPDVLRHRIFVTYEAEGQAVTTDALVKEVLNAMPVGGSCMVKIADTTGLVAGNSYPLVSYAGTLSGNFANFQLQMPYGWQGTLVNSANQIVLANVATVTTTPPQLNICVSNGLLEIHWPADHTGWRMQAQTNTLGTGLGTNWADVANSNLTNQLLTPINPGNGSVFLRVVLP